MTNRMEHILVRFTADDADTVAGRRLADAELRQLVRTLDASSISEVFAECVQLIAAASTEAVGA